MTDAEAARATAAYVDAFGRPPDLLVRAPGRVNLIGEHTDYNGGFVLPCAIDRATTIAIGRATSASTITVVAADYAGARDRFDAAAAFAAASDPPWANHVRGLFAALRARGMVTGGANIAIAGNIPQGAGLSSSAALGVALATAVTTLAGHPLDARAIALTAQAAENDFVGVACGIMDQLVSASARAGHALLIDCRSLGTTPVPVPPDTAILVIHSGIERGLVGSAYNERRRQCEAAALHYGAPLLRDVDAAALAAGRAGLDATAFRRARHVVTENARTLAAADALRHRDLAALGALFAASHASMRNDFDITLPAIDALVAIAADATGGEGGARMTGGGFGGCIVAVTSADRAAHVIERVNARYATPSGAPPLILNCAASAGAAIIAG